MTDSCLKENNLRLYYSLNTFTFYPAFNGKTIFCVLSGFIFSLQIYFTRYIFSGTPFLEVGSPRRSTMSLSACWISSEIFFNFGISSGGSIMLTVPFSDIRF